MVAKNKRRNPFYALLIIVGMTFTLTACAYGVMTVRGIHPELAAETSESGEDLMHFLDKRGFSLLMWQIGILAILTVGAMVTDSYWSNEVNDANQDGETKTTDSNS